MDPGPGPGTQTPDPGQRFAPRAVGWREGGSMLRESFALLGAAPGRLLGLYLLVYLPLFFVAGIRYLAMPLIGVLASIAYTGFYCALEAVREGRLPELRDMLAPWRLPAGKVALLAWAGLAGVAACWIAWWLDLGTPELHRLLAAPPPGGADASDAAEGMRLAVAQRVELAASGALVGIPLLMLQPICVLRPWSATRTLAANLIASFVNWRWALALAAVAFPVEVGILAWPVEGLGELFLSALAEVAFDMLASAYTLVLMHRALE